MDSIVIRGARQHNLKNVSLTIPRNALVVLTGVSGSGKSSLAFDTLFAEGQRRYVESLSAYARQFLEQMEKPDVDSIEGLSPAISIEQKTTSKNPRSTVGTVTEIHDYLRLLYASIGQPHCTSCGRAISAQTIQQMTDRVLAMSEGTRFLVLAPFVRGKKGEYRRQMGELAKKGFVRARVDGETVDLAEPPELDKQKKHTIEVIVDRLVVRRDDEARRRLTDSLETAVRVAEGLVTISVVGAKGETLSEETLSTSYACPDCGTSLPEITPRLFSFNTPYGACAACSGLGSVPRVDPDRLVPDPTLSIADGAIAMWKKGSTNWRLRQLEQLSKAAKFSMEVPWKKLPAGVRDMILHGSKEQEIKWKWKSEKGEYVWSSSYKGLVPLLTEKYKEVESEEARQELEAFMSLTPCADCGGRRLKAEALAVKVRGQAIDALAEMTLEDASEFFATFRPEPREREIAGKILKEIEDRLGFLNAVGIGYLSLGRGSATLSGGEAQRIRLATQIGSKLMGVLYVLDEPSIGLHPKDNRKLIETLMAMRDLGNTVVVVEHDEETIRAADRVVDLGPGAGVHGGEVVGEGAADELARFPRSLTGKYLSRELTIPVPAERRAGSGKAITVVAARANNLRDVTARFPRGCLTAVTGAREAGGARADRGARARRQGDRHRPVADRPDAPLEPGDLHEPLRADPRPDVAGAGRPNAGIRAGALLVQREGGALRGVRRRRPDRHRDALPPRRLRDVRRLRRPPLQPRDARGPLQGAERGRGARPDGRAGGGGLRERADDPQRRRDARGGRARLHQAGTAGDDPLGGRGAAGEAREGARPAGHGADALHPRRADDRPPLRRREEAPRRPPRPRRPGEHGDRHRAQPRRREDRRPDRRPRTGGRLPRRPDRRGGDPGGGGGLRVLRHRRLARPNAGARPRAEALPPLVETGETGSGLVMRHSRR
jgi:excinuclease ABC subunit A